MNSNTSHPKGKINIQEILRGNAKSEKTETTRLMDLYIEGINAEAKVIQIEEAGSYAGRNYCKLSLEVRPAHTKKFKVSGYAPVAGSLIPKVGDVLNIKYNSSDTEKFVII